MSNYIKHHTKKSKKKRGNLIFSKPKKRFSQTKNKNSPVEQVLNLQRTIGNRAVNRLIQSGAIQARLNIGKPNDIYEKEADRVADQVMSMKDGSLVNGHSSLAQRKSTCPESPEKKEIQSKSLTEQITPLVQRQPEEEEAQAKLLIQRQKVEKEEAQAKPLVQRQNEEEEEKPIQSKTVPHQGAKVTPSIESRINLMKGGGESFPESARSFFEPRFGADFSHVRIHTDSRAAQNAQAINARAFTIGKDIFFNSGQYSPGTISGKHLLAHELTHVVQQRKGIKKYEKIQRQVRGRRGRKCQTCPVKPSHTVDIRIAPILRFRGLGGGFGETDWPRAKVPFISIWHRERITCNSCRKNEKDHPKIELCVRKLVIRANVPVNIDRTQINRRGPNRERWYQDCGNIPAFDYRHTTRANARATMTTPRRITVRSTRVHELYHVRVSERSLRQTFRSRNPIHSLCPYSTRSIQKWKKDLEKKWKTEAQGILRGNPTEANEERNAFTHECASY